MKKIIISFIFLLFLTVVFLPPVSAGTNEKELLIGLIPEMNIFKQKERFNPLGEFLSKKTGMHVRFTILSRYGNLIDRFEKEKMDGAFFGSFTCAAAIYKLGVVPLARPVNLDNSSTYHGYIFVRKDSNIKGVNDMKGKIMAFVEKSTTAGYIFPLAYLREHGIVSPDNFFREHYFSGSHDAAIDAVLNRKADIGSAKHSIYDRVIKENPRVEQELVILGRSPSVPSNGLCVRKDLDENLKKKLKDALLNLDKDPEGQAVLKKFGAIRFIETTARDYEPVHELAVKAGIDLKKYKWKNE